MRFIGERLRQIRISSDSKLSQDQVAKYVGISPGYMSELESGKKDNPTPELVEKFAEYFHIHPTYFYLDYAYTMKQIIEGMPGLPEELKEFLQDEDSIKWLVLTEKAKSDGVPLEVLDKLVDAAREIQNSKARP